MNSISSPNDRTSGFRQERALIERRIIKVTSRNLWFLERAIPLFGMIDFFPGDSIGPPEFGRAESSSPKAKRLKLETDRGWSFESDITSDSKVFRAKSRSRGTGKWIAESGIKPGDSIIIEKLEDYRYRLAVERG